MSELAVEIADALCSGAPDTAEQARRVHALIRKLEHERANLLKDVDHARHKRDEWQAKCREQWERAEKAEAEVARLTQAFENLHSMATAMKEALESAAALAVCCAATDNYSREELTAFGRTHLVQFKAALALAGQQGEESR